MYLNYDELFRIGMYVAFSSIAFFRLIEPNRASLLTALFVDLFGDFIRKTDVKAET